MDEDPHIDSSVSDTSAGMADLSSPWDLPDVSSPWSDATYGAEGSLSTVDQDLAAPAVATGAAHTEVALPRSMIWAPAHPSAKRARGARSPHGTIPATLEKVYTELMDGYEARRPDFLEDGAAEAFYKEPLQQAAKPKRRAPKKSDKWKDEGPLRQVSESLGRFREAPSVRQGDASVAARFERCGDEDPSGIGRIDMTRKPWKIRRRARHPPYDYLPKQMGTMSADEWRMSYVFDEPARANESFPWRLFHTCAVPVQAPVQAQEISSDAGWRKFQSNDPSRAVMELCTPARTGDEKHTFVSFVEGDEVRGYIMGGEDGVTLGSGSGDNAEWYQAAIASDLPFREGEVVGLYGDKIARRTDSADTCGIISRRCITVGSLPRDPSIQSMGDTVAFVGRVPIRVRGAVNVGDALIPSGRNDGTAMAHAQSTAVARIVGTAERACSAIDADSDGVASVPVKVNPVGSVCPYTLYHRSMSRGSKVVEGKDTIQIFSNAARASATKGRRFCMAKSAALVFVLALALVILLPQVHVLEKRPVLLDAPTPAVIACSLEQISISEAGLCVGCQDKDSVVSFKAAAAKEVFVTCPPGFSGTVNRTCHANGSWSTLIGGQCTRLHCPDDAIHLPGYRDFPVESSTGTSEARAEIAGVKSHSVIFTASFEGTTAEGSCPQPAFTGKLVRKCMPNSTSWSASVSGNCTRHQCETTAYSFKTLLPLGYDAQMKMVSVNIPKTDYGTSVQVPICKKFTNTGSCVDDGGDAGFIAMECVSPGGQFARNIARGVYASAAFFEGARLSHSTEIAASLYSSFVRGVSTAIRSPPGSSWSFPTTGSGVFAAITVALNGERRPVFSTRFGPMDRRFDSEATIDTAPTTVSNTTLGRIFARSVGRSAAAFARVACRELGYEAAPVVTNCQGLAQLLDSLPHMNGTAMLSVLCPEQTSEHGTDIESECSSGFEVREPPINTSESSQLDWVKANAQKTEHIGTVARAAHVEDLPLWNHLQQFGRVGPVPESPSCDGSEDSVVRCFQHQMVIAHKLQQSWTRRCNKRMLVACSNPSESARPEAMRVTGTWVVGDSVDDTAASRMLEHPKVFDDVRGPLDCVTGELASDAKIQESIRELCWGTVFGDRWQT